MNTSATMQAYMFEARVSEGRGGIIDGFLSVIGLSSSSLIGFKQNRFVEKKLEIKEIITINVNRRLVKLRFVITG